jgi:hypothetical protein
MNNSLRFPLPMEKIPEFNHSTYNQKVGTRFCVLTSIGYKVPILSSFKCCFVAEVEAT